MNNMTTALPIAALSLAPLSLEAADGLVILQAAASTWHSMRRRMRVIGAISMKAMLPKPGKTLVIPTASGATIVRPTHRKRTAR